MRSTIHKLTGWLASLDLRNPHTKSHPQPPNIVPSSPTSDPPKHYSFRLVPQTPTLKGVRVKERENSLSLSLSLAGSLSPSVSLSLYLSLSLSLCLLPPHALSLSRAHSRAPYLSLSLSFAVGEKRCRRRVTNSSRTGRNGNSPRIDHRTGTRRREVIIS